MAIPQFIVSYGNKERITEKAKEKFKKSKQKTTPTMKKEERIKGKRG